MWDLIDAEPLFKIQFVLLGALKKGEKTCADLYKQSSRKDE